MDRTSIDTMTAKTAPGEPAGPSVAAVRRVGYLVSIAVNGFMLYVVNKLERWDLLPFLTDDFDRVLPLVNLSLIVTIAINVVRLWFAPRWFILATDVVSGIFSIGATVRILQVFPFDFDPYPFPWGIATRAILVLAIVGSLIAIAANSVKLTMLASTRN